MSMLIIATLMFLGFLCLLAGLAWAGYKFATPKVGPAPGCAGGCALGLALLAMGVFATVGFVVLVAVVFVNHAVEHSPIDNLQIERGDGPDGSSTIHLEFDLVGRLAKIVDRSTVEDIVREICDTEANVVVERRTWGEGRHTLHVDIEIPADHDGGRGAWRRIERRLKELEHSEVAPEDAPDDVPEPPGSDTREY